MSTLNTLVILSALCGQTPVQTTVATAPPRTVFQAIDARYERGEITLEQRHLYRVEAIRRPSALPASLTGYSGVASVRSGTRYLAQAFQFVAKTGDWGSPLHELLQPPDDLSYTLESTTHPIRVSYSSASQASYAQEILDAADLAWSVQIGDYGFPQPAIESGYSPFRYYVQDAGQGVAGYTSPYDLDPNADHPSCYTYIVIDPNLGNQVDSTVAHESNHAMQATLDCIENTTFWENTSTYIEGTTQPSYLADTYWFIPYFQAEPWQALNYFDNGGGYQYGGVLWLFYLTNRIAPDDGPVFVREVWEACMQSSSTENEPDYFDAIEAVAADRGADVSDMQTLYADFAEMRYFIGEDDDGAHLPNAADYQGAEVEISAQHDYGDLPVVDRQPPSTEKPSPFGTTYIRLNLTTGTMRPVIVSIDGRDTTQWTARVILTGNGETPKIVPIHVDPDFGQGSTVVDPTGYADLVLAVSNLGPEDYDPDDSSTAGVDFYYSLEPVKDPPVLTAVYPGAVLRGQQNLRLRLVGENFSYGTNFEVQFSDPAIQVISLDALTDTEALLTITVPGSAEIGTEDVTLVNGDGQEALATDAFAVVDVFTNPEPGPKPGGCQTGGSPSPLGLLFVAFVLGLLVWRRRRY